MKDWTICLALMFAFGLGSAILAPCGHADETSLGAGEATKGPAALSFKMKTLDGKDKKLSDYKGKVVLVVNVASRCGLTPQYKELQALHEKYSKKGLAIVAFPCNQFGGQEPGTPMQIQQFCTDNYGVEFDLFAKVDVNGPKRCALYKHLTSLETKPKGKGDISWNFEKFLIDRKGDVIARFSPRVKPSSKEMVGALETALSAKADALTK